jgi:GNAT superfamily N-acetyltransferase
VRRLFRARQGLIEPPRPRPPTTEPADPHSDGIQVYMIRDHLDEVPQVPFPEGFSIRPMRTGEGGLWEDIWRDAQAYQPFGPRLFEGQFSADPQATRYRSYMIVDAKDVAVGTISAWYDRNYHGQEVGVIHWVAVRPAYQGRGLGKAGMSYALHQLARWHTRAMLNTQTKRLAAIKVYLDFGFRPDLEREGALEAWRIVKAKLDHPGLDDVQ